MQEAAAAPAATGAAAAAAPGYRHVVGSECNPDVPGRRRGGADRPRRSEGQKLDWRKSIVDLMKLLDLDSSLDARKELAKELSYTGDIYDSATMNVWLHKQVMAKLAASGGKVPDDLRT